MLVLDPHGRVLVHPGRVLHPPGSVLHPAGTARDPPGTVQDPPGTVQDPPKNVLVVPGIVQGLPVIPLPACNLSPAFLCLQMAGSEYHTQNAVPCVSFFRCDSVSGMASISLSSGPTSPMDRLARSLSL